MRPLLALWRIALVYGPRRAVIRPYDARRGILNLREARKMTKDLFAKFNEEQKRIAVCWKRTNEA
jgi:hypothetical protein